MTDRELLEAAARVAGIEGTFFGSDNPIHTGIYQSRGEYYWNPLVSDSEALRLAIQLRISIEFGDDSDCGPNFMAGYFKPDGRVAYAIEYERVEQDAREATRRAIVRAAAALAGAGNEGERK